MRMYRPLLVLMIALPLGCQSSGSLWGGRHTANELVAGTGASSQKDAQLAAAEAARQALGAMGQTKAKLVLVFDQANAADATLKGVNSVFDPNIVFGCTAYSPLTEAGNNATVGVLALGGDIEVQVAMAKVDGSHQNCGRQIGRQIKQTSPAAKREGELMILFGSCHEPTDDQVVAGVRQELGDTFPVVGAAAAGSTDIYYQGKAIKDVNVGVVIRGDFHCDFAMKHAEGDGKDKLVQSAISAVQQVRATRTCGAAGQAAGPAVHFRLWRKARATRRPVAAGIRRDEGLRRRGEDVRLLRQRGDRQGGQRQSRPRRCVSRGRVSRCTAPCRGNRDAYMSARILRLWRGCAMFLLLTAVSLSAVQCDWSDRIGIQEPAVGNQPRYRSPYLIAVSEDGGRVRQRPHRAMRCGIGHPEEQVGDRPT